MQKENAYSHNESYEPMREGLSIPHEVSLVLEKLTARGHRAFVVGGCVRDILLKRKPKDWDVATNATPDAIQKIFPDSFYENAFGTVGVKTESSDPGLGVVEITTFRRDIGYSDKRHPDTIEFAKTVEEDLARRDFTVNAMAYDGQKLVDPFGGQQDLEDKRIRTVGEPSARFREDALRLMRAVRLAAELQFSLEEKTAQGIKDHAGLIEYIAKERIADELRKILMTQNPAQGIEVMRELQLLRHILPELETGYGVTQNKHHIYTVWEHNVRALQYAAEQGWNFEVRLASLLHDVGKPETKRGEGPDSTFYGHQVVGARIAARALARLKFSKELTEKVVSLIANHMFVYDPDPKIVSDASVRRLVAKVGPEHMEELIKLRIADRIGSGVPKAEPYRLRHFRFRVEKVLQEPTSRKVMAVNGNDLMERLGIPPGPRVGAILDLLFEEILDNPEHNTKDSLMARAQELHALTDEALITLREKALDRYRALLQEEEEALKEKYFVK